MLAGCRAVPYRDASTTIADDDAERALCLWVNTPGNPTGELDDLGGRGRVGPRPRRPGAQRRVLRRVHLGRAAAHDPRARHRRRARACTRCRSARTSPACGRASTPATPTSCDYLREVRKHAGFMVPGPVQAAAVAACGDDEHVDAQRERYRSRLERLRDHPAATVSASTSPMPDGGFYLWAPAPGGDAWALAKRLATEAGALVSPGEFYGPDGAGHVRLAVVQPDDRIELVGRAARRLTDAAVTLGAHGRPRGRDRRALGAPRRARARRRRRPRHRARGDRPARPRRGPGRRGRRRRRRRPRVAEAGDPAAVPLLADGDDRARAVRVRRQDPAEARLRRGRRAGRARARRPAGARSSTAA